MTPYSVLAFFCILLVVCIPAVILGHGGKSLRIYGACATLTVLLCVFAGWRAKLLLLGFWAVQTALCFGYLRLRKRHAQRWLLWAFLTISLLPLIAVKLAVFWRELSILSILGISYMSFRAVQVLIEIYDGRLKKLNLLDFSYFLLFFPSLSSGPIDRYQRFAKDLHATPDKEKYAGYFREGMWRIFTGALYNFVIGGLIWEHWLSPLPAHGFAATVLYMYGYTFFLFFNFAGYSRMAIGTAYLFGIPMAENFNAPFISRDMKEFWSRWHISLSTFLRDYVYTRFCMEALRKKWFRGKRTASYVGYFLTMLLMGAWHGLTPGYLIYGAYQGVLMSVNEVLDTRWKRFKTLKKQPVAAAVMTVITFHLFSFGLLLFSGRLI